jgi:cytochrome c553
MRKIMKWMGVAIGGLVLAVALLLAAAWIDSEHAMARRYAVQDPPLALPADAASVAQGKHLWQTRGCSDCHGSGGEGRLVMDAGPLIKLVAPNITPPALTARGYDADKIARAVRHGVRADDTPLIFMPSGDWTDLGDTDTAALVAHIQSLPPSANDPGPIEVRPLSRILHLFGQFPLTPAEDIDHAPRTRGAPAAEPTLAFGRYVASTCMGCHGENFAGGKPIAPGTPRVANLTRLKAWTQADFTAAMRTGKRPDGSAIDPFMPWQMVGRMTDTELTALYTYFQSLPESEPRS